MTASPWRPRALPACLAALLAILAPALAAAQTATVLTGTITTNGGRVELTNPDRKSYGVATIDISGTYTGTTSFQVLGTTRSNVLCSVASSTSTATGTTSGQTGKWVCPVSGWQAVSVVGTSAMTGTATVRIAYGPGGGAGGGGGGGGSFDGVLKDSQGDSAMDDTNNAARVNVVAGSTAGKTDDDDASIAAGQTAVGLNAVLNQAFDGSVWRRITFGTAGSASAQVWTVQGIASMTPLLITGTGTAGSAATGVQTVQGIASMTPLLVTLSGTNNVTNAGTFAVQAAGTGSAGSPNAGVMTIQGIASGTNVNVACQAGCGSTAGGVVSTANSTSTNLGSGAAFTGTSEDVTAYSTIQLNIFNSHTSATDGVSVQQSSNGTNWDHVDTFTVSGARVITVPVVGQFYRLVYTNGATLTTSLRVQSIFHAAPGPARAMRPADANSNEVNLSPGASYLFGYNASTWDRIRTFNTGQLGISLRDAAGNSRGANVDANNRLAVNPDGSATYGTAAAAADATANPTFGGLRDFAHIFNGTTWDRMRGAAAATDSTGTGIQAVAPTFQLDDVSTTTVTENQFAHARISTRRAQLIEGVSGGTAVGVDSELPAAAAAADGAANPTAPFVIAAGALWNGTTWDRAPGTAAAGAKVDTEMTAAAASADATANPTIPGVGTFPYMYNGTTWDRVRGDTTNGLTTNTELPAAAALANATSNPTVPGVGAYMMVYNGTTWDRMTVPTSGCDDPSKVTQVNVSMTAASGNIEVVALTSSQVVYVCGYSLFAGGDADITFVYGTGTNCGTGTTTIATPLSTSTTIGYGVSVSNGGAVQAKTIASNALCIGRSASVTLKGMLTYVKQ